MLVNTKREVRKVRNKVYKTVKNDDVVLILDVVQDELSEDAYSMLVKMLERGVCEPKKVVKMCGILYEEFYTYMHEIKNIFDAYEDFLIG